MTIVSKVSKARAHYNDALIELQKLLNTKRGVAAARDEKATLREQSRDTELCPYCQSQIVIRSTRHTEACDKCGKTIDSALQLKSKIINGVDDSWVLKQMLSFYNELKYVPYAFRGCTGDHQDVVNALNNALLLHANWRAEYRAASARNATYEVERRRREEIFNMLVSLGMSPEGEEIQQRVEEIYWTRYGV